MRLYNITPKPSIFNWPDETGLRRPVQMTGVWLGTPGRDFRHSFTPIVIGETEPDEARWGLKNSRTERPKIAANHDLSLGYLAVLSSYTGNSHIVGHVFVREDHLENFQVLDFGIGGSEESGSRYHEYLVHIFGDHCDFAIQPTVTPDQRIVFGPGYSGVHRTEIVSIPQGYVNLDDTSILRWNRAKDYNNGES